MTKRIEETAPRGGLGVLTFVGGLLALVAALAVLPSLLSAQQVDSRWLPWIGCWQVADAGVDQVLCIEPGDDAGAVRMDYSGEDVEDQLFRANGEPVQVSQAGCQGEERASFSPDGRRIYITASYLCDGGTVQSGTGLITMVAEDEWVEIRSLAVDGEHVAWVQRYVQATPAAVQAAGERDLVTPDILVARRLASRPPTLSVLAEVARGVDAKVASAWIVESGYPFQLNGEQLVALADAGVDPEVIDVAVAVSNPRHFNLGPAGDPTREDNVARPRGVVGSFGYTPYFGRRYFGYGQFYSPWGYLAYSPYGYDPFYYGYGYGYSPYSYGGYRPAYIVVTRNTGTGYVSDRGTGRAVAGRGYTRTRSGGSNPPSGSSGYSPPRSSSGGSSAGTTSSGGGSSSTGTRTAKPRSGGGGI